MTICIVLRKTVGEDDCCWGSGDLLRLWLWGSAEALLLALRRTVAEAIKMSVTTANSLSQDYTNGDDHIWQTFIIKTLQIKWKELIICHKNRNGYCNHFPHIERNWASGWERVNWALICPHLFLNPFPLRPGKTSLCYFTFSKGRWFYSSRVGMGFTHEVSSSPERYDVLTSHTAALQDFGQQFYPMRVVKMF